MSQTWVVLPICSGRACSILMPSSSSAHSISTGPPARSSHLRNSRASVTDCIVGFRVPYIKGPDTEPLEDKIKHLEQYAENVIALQRALLVVYESSVTGVPVPQVIEQHQASSGMRAFSEGR